MITKYFRQVLNDLIKASSEKHEGIAEGMSIVASDDLKELILQFEVITAAYASAIKTERYFD